jgi:hypothetical protein
MSTKPKKYSLFKKNLKQIADVMIPGDELMPCFTKAVKIEIIFKKYFKNKFIISLKKKRINLSIKNDWDIYEKVLGDDILEAYFTSNLVIKVLNLRKKKYLKDTKKENMFKLLEKVKYKKNFIKINRYVERKNGFNNRC